MSKATDLLKYYNRDIFLHEKSVIAWFNYDFPNKELTVVFRNGRTYKYLKVYNGNFNNLLFAKNKANFFFNNIMRGGKRKQSIRLENTEIAVIDLKVKEHKSHKFLAR